MKEKIWLIKIKGEIPNSNESGYIIARNRKEVDAKIDDEIYPYLEHRYGDDINTGDEVTPISIQEVFNVKVRKTRLTLDKIKGENIY